MGTYRKDGLFVVLKMSARYVIIKGNQSIQQRDRKEKREHKLYIRIMARLDKSIG